MRTLYLWPHSKEIEFKQIIKKRYFGFHSVAVGHINEVIRQDVFKTRQGNIIYNLSKHLMCYHIIIIV